RGALDLIRVVFNGCSGSHQLVSEHRFNTRTNPYPSFQGIQSDYKHREGKVKLEEGCLVG
ncbi:hypothetical protein LINPERPRIM_LOCUS863, partial [Linum perenne]